MSLRGFATLNFWADDVAEAAAWYTEFLGSEPMFTRPGADGRTGTRPPPLRDASACATTSGTTRSSPTRRLG